MKKFGFALVIILVVVVTACSHGSQVADVPVLQQGGETWPRCISGCVANDVEINAVSLNVTAGNYTLGETLTHNVSMDLYFHRQNTYCIVVVADLYEGGVLQQTDWVSNIIGYHGGSGSYTYPMGAVSWTYGSLFEMRNVLVMWAPNSPPGGTCPTDCSEYTAPSKCNQPPTFIVTTPLVVNFEFDAVCFCNSTTFTDRTTGGVEPYTWHWDFGDGDSSTAQNATHHFDAAGNYTVTLNVTDSDSPPATAGQSYDVTVYPNPTVNITPDGGELTCTTTFIVLTADTTGSACGVTSYQWYKDNAALGGETGTTLNVTSPGDYKVEVECANSCTDEDEVTVTLNADYPTVNIIPDGGELTCTTTFIILTADTTGSACGVASYQWYKDNVALGGETGTTLNVTSLGDYKVEVECANSCTDEDQVAVALDISIPSVNAGPDQEVCEDGLPITLSGATPSGGSWTGTGVSGNTFDPSGLPPGEYTVTYSYTDPVTGCSSSDTKTVRVNPRPTADAGPDRVILLGDSVVIGGTPTANATSPYTVSWTPATGLDNASFDNPNASPTVNTTYTVTVTDSRGCTDTDGMFVTVDETCCVCGFVYRYGTGAPLAGWTVILEKQTNPWVVVGNTTTAADGKYCFCGLESGYYRVSEVVQPGWSQVSPLPNEFVLTTPGGCCDPQTGPFLIFQNQQGGPIAVGWEVYPTDKLAVLAPWVALLAAIAAGTSLLVRRRRRA